MARQLLSPVVAAAAFAMSACIVPPDLRFIDPPPGSKNRPPRILPDTVRPSEPLLDVPRECQREFSFFVDDPDVGDTLTVCTYVDWDPNNNACYGGQTIVIADPVSGPQPYSITFRPFDPRSPLNGTGTHVIEIFVTDGDFGPDRLPEPTLGGMLLPDGGAPDPRYYDKWVWVVNVQDGMCLP